MSNTHSIPITISLLKLLTNLNKKRKYQNYNYHVCRLISLVKEKWFVKWYWYLLYRLQKEQQQWWWNKKKLQENTTKMIINNIKLTNIVFFFWGKGQNLRLKTINEYCLTARRFSSSGRKVSISHTVYLNFVINHRNWLSYR